MEEIDGQHLEEPRQTGQQANVIYYFHVGAGNWAGTFQFTITKPFSIESQETTATSLPIWVSVLRAL